MRGLFKEKSPQTPPKPFWEMFFVDKAIYTYGRFTNRPIYQIICNKKQAAVASPRPTTDRPLTRRGDHKGYILRRPLALVKIGGSSLIVLKIAT